MCGVPPLSGLVWVVVGCVRVVDALSLFFLWVSFCVVTLWSLGDGECGGDGDGDNRIVKGNLKNRGSPLSRCSTGGIQCIVVKSEFGKNYLSFPIFAL